MYSTNESTKYVEDIINTVLRYTVNPVNLPMFDVIGEIRFGNFCRTSDREIYDI